MVPKLSFKPSSIKLFAQSVEGINFPTLSHSPTIPQPNRSPNNINFPRLSASPTRKTDSNGQVLLNTGKSSASTTTTTPAAATVSTAETVTVSKSDATGGAAAQQLLATGESTISELCEMDDEYHQSLQSTTQLAHETRALSPSSALIYAQQNLPSGSSIENQRIIAGSMLKGARELPHPPAVVTGTQLVPEQTVHQMPYSHLHQSQPQPQQQQQPLQMADARMVTPAGLLDSFEEPDFFEAAVAMSRGSRTASHLLLNGHKANAPSAYLHGRTIPSGVRPGSAGLFDARLSGHRVTIDSDHLPRHHHPHHHLHLQRHHLVDDDELMQTVFGQGKLIAGHPDGEEELVVDVVDGEVEDEDEEEDDDDDDWC